MAETKLQKDFKCETCGKQHHFSAYVFAHWDETLLHTCDGCGAKHDIFRGNAKLVTAGRPPSQEAAAPSQSDSGSNHG